VIVVTGHLVVDAQDRDRHLELSRPAVVAARALEGCLDFAVSPDLVDPTRVNVLERWSSRAALEEFRADGPSGELAELIRDARVEEIEIGEPEPGEGPLADDVESSTSCRRTG